MDKHGDTGYLACVFLPPDILDQLRARENNSRITRQHMQYMKLLGREFDFLPAHFNPAALDVDLQVVILYLIGNKARYAPFLPAPQPQAVIFMGGILPKEPETAAAIAAPVGVIISPSAEIVRKGMPFMAQILATAGTGTGSSPWAHG